MTYKTFEEVDEAFRAGKISKGEKTKAKRKVSRIMRQGRMRLGRRYVRSIKRVKHTGRLPKWADRNELRQFYRNCPEGMTVDHIVPLHGELVSGLHVVENLQYLTEKENLLKRNHFTPSIVTQDKGNKTWHFLKRMVKNLRRTIDLL